jgi:hypothetical protein
MTNTRIEGMKATAESWTDANPFKASLLKRLALMGGLHRPPQASDDRIIMADEDTVSLMRELPAAVTEFVQEF